MAGAVESGMDMLLKGPSPDIQELSMENGENLFAPDTNGMEMEVPANINTQTALVSPTNDEYEYILEVIKERVEEGQGETIYEVGIGVYMSYYHSASRDSFRIIHVTTEK